MNKISFSLLLMVVLMAAGLPGATILRASAATSGLTMLANDVIVTTDHYHHPPSHSVKLASTHGPAVALLQTIPPFPGVTFQIAGQQYVTGADGTAAIMVPAAGSYDLQVVTNTFHDPYRRLEFSRWLSEDYQPTRQIHLPSNNGPIQVGLNVYELVGEKFVDLQGKPVDPQRLKQFSIRSVQGDTFTFHDGTPRWIPASRVTRRREGGLQQVPLLWTITEALVDGSNVVNKSQQQFYAQPNGTWTISLLFYNLQVTAQDALFGFPLGKAVQLQLPNGQIQTYPLDKSGTAQMHSLARGNYDFKILGVNGISTTAPIALSKDQQVETRVISYLDLGVIGAAGAILALALIIFGQISLRRKRARERTASRIRITQP